MNAFPAGPLAANRPNESRELENSGRVRATSGSYPAFIRIFRSLDTGTSSRALWSLRWNSICSGYARIRGPLDSFLAQLTVSNIPKLVGQHLEKSIFPCRRKLSFFIFRISIERSNNAPPFILISIVRTRALLLCCEILNKNRLLYYAVKSADI